MRVQLTHVRAELAQRVTLVSLVEDREWARKLGFGSVLEVSDVLGDDLAIDNKKSDAVDHVGDHHDRIDL